MDLSSDDLPYFVAFVLLDEARRSPSGKRQTAPLKGMWMSRQGATGMRLSDRRLRCAVCIEALRSVGGVSVDKAAVEVAVLLVQQSAEQVNVIRVGCYEWRRRHAQAGWYGFFTQFLRWRKVGLRIGSRSDSSRLANLPAALGATGAPLSRHVDLATAKRPSAGTPQSQLVVGAGTASEESDRVQPWDPGNDWQQLATDLWTLGRLHAGIGDSGEARILLSRALEVWQIRGHKVAETQNEAIPMLEAEIARLCNAPKMPRPCWQATLRPGPTPTFDEGLLSAVGCFKCFKLPWQFALPQPL